MTRERAMEIAKVISNECSWLEHNADPDNTSIANAILAAAAEARREVIAELREWLDEPDQFYGAIVRQPILAKLDEMEEK